MMSFPQPEFVILARKKKRVSGGCDILAQLLLLLGDLVLGDGCLVASSLVVKGLKGERDLQAADVLLLLNPEGGLNVCMFIFVFVFATLFVLYFTVVTL